MSKVINQNKIITLNSEDRQSTKNVHSLKTVSNDEMQSIFYSPKILYHPDRLTPYIENFQKVHKSKQLKNIHGIVPVLMEIDLTNLCSHFCPLCVGHRIPNSNEEELFPVEGDGEQMPTENARKYINQMAEAGVKALTFTGGGEPTIHVGLTSLVDYASKLGLKVGLITHGGLLHKLDIDTLLNACTWIRVSIDAANHRQFKKVHGRDEAEWNRVWQNLLRLVEHREKHHAMGNQKTATLGVAFLAGPHTVEGLFDFVKLARDYRVDYAQIRPFHGFANFDVTEEILEAQKRYNSDSFKVVGSFQKYSLIEEGKIKPRNYFYCHFSQFSSVICANEKMYVCCHYRNIEDYCIGDLRKDSFLNIVVSKKRAEVLARIKVENCLQLCRGDHVNRQVQRLLNGETQVISEEVKPKHVDFI